MNAPARVDYEDRFTIAAGPVGATPERWARAMFGDVPNLGEKFIWRVLLGLRLAPGRSPSTVAGWRVDGRGDDWIRLATRSWFMSANLVVSVADGEVALVTSIGYDRWPARVIWPPLSAAHRFLVPGVLRDARARISRPAPAPARSDSPDLRRRHLFPVGVDPAAQAQQRFEQRLPERGERVLDPGRHGVVHRAGHQPVLPQPAQRLAEHLRRQARNRPLQVARPLRAGAQFEHHEHRPLAGDQFQPAGRSLHGIQRPLPYLEVTRLRESAFLRRRGGRPTVLRMPTAIAMWDFSWLERRWPGAGYEDWGVALDELVERGYDAVRVDAYPHLVAAGAGRERELLPVWNQQAWGSPARTVVRVQPALSEFVAACAERGVRVALSTWFRRDADDLRMRITTPEEHGRVWVATLDALAADELLGSVMYVDLCNEFAGHTWAPFFSPDAGDDDRVPWNTPRGHHWMRTAIDTVRAAYPDLDYTFSFIGGFDRAADVSALDLLDLHVFMASWSDFDDRVGYTYDGFDPAGYENLARNGERLYRADPGHWQAALRAGIHAAADWARHAGKPLVTTECWGVINYKDGPLLDWGWVKELNEHGVTEAVATGAWTAMATSTFCGPQFVGMWRDVAWHRRLTDLIRR